MVNARVQGANIEVNLNEDAFAGVSSVWEKISVRMKYQLMENDMGDLYTMLWGAAFAIIRKKVGEENRYYIYKMNKKGNYHKISLGPYKKFEDAMAYVKTLEVMAGC